MLIEMGPSTATTPRPRANMTEGGQKGARENDVCAEL